MTDPLAKLFGSAARIKLLRLFLFNPRSTFTIVEAAERSAVDEKTVRAEIKIFVATGLVRRAGKPRQSRFALNPDFVYVQALQALLLNAPARAEDLYERLRSAGSLKLIITAGIFAGEWESLIDLLIVGDRVNERKLQQKIRALESEVGKEIRYALLTTPDFFYRLNISDRLLRDVMDYPHAVVYDRLNIGLK